MQHLPFVGELRLRRLLPGRTRPTVPVLVDGDRVLSDSWDIAVWADQHGNGAPLVPKEKEDEIRGWADRADAIMGAARGLVVEGLLQSPEALDESLALPLPGFVKRGMRPVARFGTRWFARKYDLRLGDRTGPETRIREGLEALRQALDGRRYLTGTFSYADIVMATFLQGVSPVSDDYIRLGPATRRVWTLPALASDFSDLLRWRDELYRQHRR